LAGGPARFPQDSSCPVVLGNLVKEVHVFSSTGLSPSTVNLFQDYSTKTYIGNFSPSRTTGRLSPSTPLVQRVRPITYKQFELFPFRSPLLRKSNSLSFPEVTEMFHFASLPLQFYFIQIGVSDYKSERFPDSETPGSKDVYSSPGIIAVNHVLHRLLVPRHPLCALSNLTILFNFTRRYIESPA